MKLVPMTTLPHPPLGHKAAEYKEYQYFTVADFEFLQDASLIFVILTRKEVTRYLTKKVQRQNKDLFLMALDHGVNVTMETHGSKVIIYRSNIVLN